MEDPIVYHTPNSNPKHTSPACANCRYFILHRGGEWGECMKSKQRINSDSKFYTTCGLKVKTDFFCKEFAGKTQ